MLKNIFLTLLLLSGNSFAKNHLIMIQTQLGSESMVFDPPFIHIEKGDSLTFKPSTTTDGHNSESIFTPDKAKTWKSTDNETYTHTFETEGVYIYQCSNHAVMSMLGVIQVGKANNLKQAQTFVQDNKNLWPVNSHRIETYMKQVK